MILCFPDLDTFRLVLTTGIVPTDISLRPAAVHLAADGSHFIETYIKLSKTTADELKKLGVKGAKSAPGPLAPIGTWLEVLPLTKLPGTPELSTQVPVLFELPSAAELPAIVGEMLRLGNDRQSYRWLANPDDSANPRVLLRVIGPPYYTLLRALDRVATADDGQPIRAYLEQAPRVWVEIGYTHPLGSLVKLGDEQALLFRAPREWVHLTDAPFRDVYDILQFPLPASTVDWQPVELGEKLKIPLKLVPGNATDAAEMWVLRGAAIDQLDAFVREADERTAQRLTFAVAKSPTKEDVVVLRLTPSKAPPPEIRLVDAIGYRPYWKIPNLFIPTGTRLHPQLRREAVRGLLAEDTDKVVWLAPREQGQFTPESLSEDAFRPLEDWVEYVIETSQVPLGAWVQATTFEFQQFICVDSRDTKPKGPEKGSKERKAGDRDEPLLPTSNQMRGVKKPDAGGSTPVAEFVPVPDTRPVNEWKTRRDDLQTRFLAIDGAMDREDRLALWPELAIANAGAGDPAEAAICWVNAMWERADPPSEYVSGWARSEAGTTTLTAAEIDSRLKSQGMEPTANEVRQFVSLLYRLETRPDVPAWLRSRLPAIQRYIEANEGKLPVRAVWLVSTRLASLAGADVLGLARVRDRLLQRLLDGGLNAELDLPYFLRTAGLKDSSRVRVVKDRLGELHGLVRKWAEKAGKSPTSANTSDNSVSLCYIDLLFSFAFAKLGEITSSRTLLESARKVMEHPAPTQDRAIAESFLFKAFRYRIEQAIAGQPHGGLLDPAILAELDEIYKKGPATPTVNNPYSMAYYAIIRMREQSRILEPQERLEPYAEMMKHGDELKKSLAALPTIRDTALLARTIRELYKSSVGGKATAESRFLVLHEGLELSARVGEAFSVELLALVPETLRGVAEQAKIEPPRGTYATGQTPIGELAKKQGQLLERALTLAGHYDLRDIAHQTVTEFVILLRGKTEDERFKLVNIVAKESLRNLRKLGLRDEVDRILGILQEVVLQQQNTKQLRARYAAKPDQWARVMQTQLSLASGWLAYDLPHKALPILEEARQEIQGDLGTKLISVPIEYTRLVQSYIDAVGQQEAETGLPELCDFFRTLNPAHLNNGYSSAKFYSRFHLNIAEELINAVVSNDFALGPAGRRWLEEDEMLVRRRIHRDMRSYLETLEKA